MKKGAINETKKYRELDLPLHSQHTSNSIIGLKEIESFLAKKISMKELKEQVLIKTRQYAKRQFTWARGHMKSWEMIYSSDLDDLFRKAINKIS